MLFKGLFGRKKEPSLNELVGRTLAELPRCSKYIIVASPKYENTKYRCEVIVDAQDLVDWADHHAKAVLSMSVYQQAARVSLPLWLRGADQSRRKTYPNELMHRVLEPYTLDFIEKYGAKVFCIECDSIENNVHIQRKNEKRNGPWVRWTDEWRCSHNHLLYYEDQELRFS